MRMTVICASLALLVGLGCYRNPGPEAEKKRAVDNKKDENKDNRGAEAKGSFQVKVPDEMLTLKQGEKKQLTINLVREGGHDKAVLVTINAPAGVVVAPVEANVAGDTTTADFSVLALPNAVPGEAALVVSARPEPSGGKVPTIPVKIVKDEAASKDDKEGNKDDKDDKKKDK